MIRVLDLIGLGVIFAAGLGLAVWWWVERAAEAAWAREVAAWRRGGDVMTALSAEVRSRSDRLARR